MSESVTRSRPPLEVIRSAPTRPVSISWATRTADRAASVSSLIESTKPRISAMISAGAAWYLRDTFRSGRLLAMQHEAVVFDFFGTLIDNYDVREYARYQEEVSRTLSLPHGDFLRV